MKKSITVDGVKYYATKPKEIDSEIKIVVLQRGWILVGRFEKKENECKLFDSCVIRSWGTTNGLGQLAKDGPTSSTKLDKNNGLVQFDYLTVVLTLSCEEENWKKFL